MSPVIGWLIKVGALAIAALGSFIAVKKYKMKPDNVIEEIIEEKIEEETGLDVDLSPDNPDSEDEASK
jgi:hypothetical protein